MSNRSTIIVASLLLCQQAHAGADHMGFEQPQSVKEVDVKPRPGENADTAHYVCSYYRDWFVKDVGFGGKGDGIVSAAPLIPGGPKPECGPAKAAGERLILRDNHAGGYVGGLLFMGSGMGADGVEPFAIARIADGHPVYSDGESIMSSAHPMKVSFASGILTLTFTRGVVGPCSILQGGQTCWARFAREMHLARELAQRPAPVATCAAGLKMSDVHPYPDSDHSSSVISYDVTMTIDMNGNTNVLSRGPFSCWPQE